MEPDFEKVLADVGQLLLPGLRSGLEQGLGKQLEILGAAVGKEIAPLLANVRIDDSLFKISGLSTATLLDLGRLLGEASTRSLPGRGWKRTRRAAWESND